MYLDPNNDMYNSLLPADCIDGACSFPKTSNIYSRRDVVGGHVLVQRQTGQIETDLPYYGSVDLPDKVAFGNCSIYKRQPVPLIPLNIVYSSCISGALNNVDCGSLYPRPSPTFASLLLQHWDVPHDPKPGWSDNEDSVMVPIYPDAGIGARRW
uniref:Uncharacterized protein n=1 Tax=Pseudictyota dubia TaxID=2749911 RepID=A0A7R9W8Q0_9STRA|mmetsp:Transcript_37300/g.69028  ORF Transcript_37300/g.69028 Transcript_37300/m.69028 type:complete len:154 (+) Transcript_37300:103-564(+)|eukprot:CAMPEP_0197461964 /NCGR_PEP_ID=MMETSP1175-20131217/57854_1 /TAXON_ID=1003142 /ORGANISM="Triceratium dubium, Strain CCMP147" /LENGTH=153 /DNA_ID=CAMNT_0042997355 /DNA_START=91 /DNA_END=552 /DNA_ORIENTATION=-